MLDTRQLPLLQGERALWEGVPTRRLLLRPSEIFLIPFSLLWAGFALFWNVSVWTTDAPIEFKLFGLPFVLAGVYVTVGRFALDIWMRRRLRYAITDQRILILRGGNTKSVDIKRLPTVELDDRGDGTGTIRFGPAANWFGGGAAAFGIWQPSFDTTPQFIGIAHVRSVYELIQRHAA